MQRAANHEEAKAMLDAHPGAAILDVRTEREYITGHLDGALLLPFDEIDAASAAELLPERTEPVLVYCRTGSRSAQAVKTLAALGYTELYDLGGLADWPYGL